LTGYLLTGISLGFYAAMAPGPFQAFLLSQSLKNGWQRTLPASLTPLFTDGPIIALVLLLLTQTPNWFLSALRIVGGFFIVYLAKGAFDSFRQEDFSLKATAEASERGMFKAIMMNALNPNPYIFWSVVAGPILLEGWRQSPRLGLSFLLGFYGTMVSGLAGLIILFATARQFGPKVTRILSGVSAAALLIFGLYQSWEGIRLWNG
jgi:threonine/homoserine/homoserine lactone efflux protein